MTSIQREVYEKFPIDGFRTQRVESIALTASEKRIFAGTVDGTLVAYHNCPLFESTGTSTRFHSCAESDVIRKQPKDKKPITNLLVVELWRIVLGIIDGAVTAYDLHSCQPITSIAETKGCLGFAVHEKSSILVVAIKRKLSLYVWQGSGFVPRREISLSDFPKTVACAANMIVVGYKRHYESIDLTSFAISRLLDVDKEHRMVCLELPQSPLRNTSLILSIGLQGVLIDISGSSGGSSGSSAFGSSSSTAAVPTIKTSGLGDRLEWASAPVAMNRLTPYLLTLLSDSVEVHNEASLMSLQRIRFPTGSASATLSLTTCYVGMSNNGAENGFVSNGDQLLMLRMVPLATQVATLVDAGQFEDTLNICALCKSSAALRDVDVEMIHERYALSLFQKGDFDGCISHYIAGKSNVVAVLMLFPDLVPVALQSSYGSVTRSTRQQSASTSRSSAGIGTPSGWGPMNRLNGVVMNRAAVALAAFCEYHRASISGIADRAERLKGAGIGATMAPGLDDEDIPNDPEEAIRTSELLDTALISALVNCTPPRRKEVVALLSKPNRCHIESCSVLLASQGNSFTEALLWLYRSHNEHRRVLNALTEDKCVGSEYMGAWSRDQFYEWTAEYLRWMWFHESDSALPTLALQSLRPLLEYNAELGLSVLTRSPRKGGKSGGAFGGKAVTVQDVLLMLDSVAPNSRRPAGAGVFGSASSTGTGKRVGAAGAKSTVLSGGNGDETGCPLKVAGVVFPLLTGRSLGVAYLEWLVASGTAPPSIHNDYGQMLIEGIPLTLEKPIDHASNNLEFADGDSETIKLYKVYRKKLQHFLQNSTEYHAERLLKVLPPQYLHEYSLLLSRLGRHEEVLRIYIHRLNDFSLAEQYCDRIYQQLREIQLSLQVDEPRRSTGLPVGIGSQGRGAALAVARSSAMGSSALFSDFSEAGDVYLCLLKVVLTPSVPEVYRGDSDDEDEHAPISRSGAAIQQPSAADRLATLTTVVSLAERYFDRFDSAAFLRMLPSNAPLVVLSKYLNIIVEFNNTKKRNLQVVHSLLRIREVNLKTSNS